MYKRLRIIYVISLAMIISSIIGIIDNAITIVISSKNINYNSIIGEETLRYLKVLLPSFLVIIVLSVIIVICKKYNMRSKEELTLKNNTFFIGVYILISSINKIVYIPIKINELIKVSKTIQDKAIIHNQFTSIISRIIILILTIILGILMIKEDFSKNKQMAKAEIDSNRDK